MSTLSEAIEELEQEGFTEHFGVEGSRLRGLEGGDTFGSNEVVIRSYQRFEGVSDPDDMSILYAIESLDGTCGTLVDAFGVYSDPIISAFVHGVAVQRPAPRAQMTRPASWSIGHISAVTVAVRDMDTSVAFYQKLGLEVTYGGPDASFTTLRTGESVINLRRRPNSSGNPWDRVILRVRGVDALREELLARGLEPTAPRDAQWGERYFEIAAPEGLVISFAELL